MNRSRLPPALLLLCASWLSACATWPGRADKPQSSAVAPATDTPSARYIQSELRRQPRGQSGFRLLSVSSNALMSRIALADGARHAIDLQYYIFKNDATGRLVAQHLLMAADRGVRVRMLLDDLNLAGQREMLDAFDAHPNIEVRLFNPFRTREPTLASKIMQVLLDGSRLNRRMHNKSFIVDNKVAVIGGRNIGDDYFDASDDSNFRDLDLVAIGPVVAEASRSFDAYWRSDVAVPVTAFPGIVDAQGDLQALRPQLAREARAFAQTDYALAIIDELPDGATADRRGVWFWGEAIMVADAPEKAESGTTSKGFRIAPMLAATIDDAQQALLMISPYFIPGRQDIARLLALRRRGVAVAVLTNSLAATDEGAVYAKYAQSRVPLLAGGVALYELRPVAGGRTRKGKHGQSSGVALHAKALVIDDHITFIGSLNLDPRSALVNTEMGLVVDSVPLAAAVTEFFAAATRPAAAYQLRLDVKPGMARERLIWLRADDNGDVREIGHEPDTTAGTRLRMRLMKLLPIKSLL